MKFLRKLFVNFIILIILAVGLYFVMPDIMGPVYQLYYALLGPGIIILLIIMTILPDGRRR